MGSPTSTCWKRRSSAGSFSIRSRYSSSVVAPTMRSSPRASIGLSMLPASIAPSAAPAPTTVCSSSMNVMTWPSVSLISLSTALSRSSNSPRYFAPATIAPRSSAISRLSAQRLGHVAGDDPLGQALDDGGLADAGLADQHRVVLGPPGQHLDDPADLGVPADDRVELAVAGRLRSGRRRTSPAPGRCPRGPALVTRRVPRTCSNALEQRVRRGAVPASAARPTGPPSAARPTSRCSVETYSSASSLGLLGRGGQHLEQRRG